MIEELSVLLDYWSVKKGIVQRYRNAKLSSISNLHKFQLSETDTDVFHYSKDVSEQVNI